MGTVRISDKSKLISTPRWSSIVIAASIACISYSVHANPVRQSSAEFIKDPAKVAALQKAVAAMRANDDALNTSPAYLASWQYWSNIHGYLGLGPHALGTTATYIPQQIALRCAGDALCISYYQHAADTPLPADRFTAQVWGNCQHGNLNFLPWHRLYLHYFERVLRKQSGVASFAFPYWDYFNEKGVYGGMALPKLVIGPASNPLVNLYHTPGLNDRTKDMNVVSGNADQAFKFTDFISFSNQLQAQPHGVMHCATGLGCKAPDIGLTGLSGLDPLFYMHHANIDRLWQCWLNRKANGQTIDLAWAKANLGMPDSWYATSYTFVDENGNLVTRTIGDIFTPGVIDTHYDKETDCPTAMPVVKHASLTREETSAKAVTLAPMSNPDGAVLKGKTHTVALVETSNMPSLSAGSSGSQVPSVKPGHALLTIENIDVHGDPDVTYDIYLVNKFDAARTAYIATLSYFGIFEPSHEAHQHPAHKKEKIGTLTYDVQDELMRLGVKSTADVLVRFVPSNNMMESIKKERTSTGSVTVGQIRLEKVNGPVMED